MKLPFLISVPHGGTDIPPEIAQLNLLNREQIIKDGDEGAAEIYAIPDHVTAFHAADVARAFVDVNRAADDRRRDGVVKTHTIWDEPIYRQPLSDRQVETLLSQYYRPYHTRLTALASQTMLGIDCHTMAEIGPPIGPLAGQARPLICLSNGDDTCPESWFMDLADCLSRAFNIEVSRNFPFKGGFIIHAHAAELPWVQLEMSRAPWLTNVEKRELLLDALCKWQERH
jgi:N-formylglutamate deformylase